nr:DUF2256 domain-containing protein [Thiosulfativibrio zosterae]
MQKQHLPSKDCPVCHKPFVWRKKWAKDWETVIYCSERCQRQAKQQRRQLNAEENP